MQEQLFTIPTKPAILPVSLGRCIKCGKDATLASASGNPKSIYCEQCGKCKRKVYDTMSGVVVVRKLCSISVEDFMWHRRLGIWCCPCILRFEKEFAS